MFDFVRKHTKIMMFVMFLLIIPSFVLFGIDGYNRFRDKGEVVAQVGGHAISQGEWDAAHKSDTDRLRASMPNLDAKLLDSPEARYAALERLVKDQVLTQTAAALKLSTSDARLARELQDNPTIASLRRPDGSIDMARYSQLVASQGLTPEGFEARVRQDLSVRQVEAGVTASGFAPSAMADLALQAFFERREVQVAAFTPAEFIAKVNPSDAELEAYYKANPQLFQAPEEASIEYLVLDLEAVKKTITISEGDLRTYYEQNAARLSGKEERRASHILINAPKAQPEAERLKAKARATELLQAVRKAPDSFADLARKNSQDPGSAANGGDLDFFARGAMVKPFEDAVFAMKKGEISEVVESDFGYHIIKLTDLKTPTQRPFEELRAGMESDLKAQQAQRKFAESAELFSNGVYEQSDSLKPVADKLKLELRTADRVTRQPAPGASGALANPKFLQAMFGPDALEKKRNTDAVELAPNQLAAGRIVKHTPARTLPFAEVRATVRERLVAAGAADLARKEGSAKLAAWKAGPDSAVLPAAITVARDQPQNLSPVLLKSILKADAATLPALFGVDLGSQGYAVVRLLKTLPRPAANEANLKQDRAQYGQWWTNAESQAYFGLLKERSKVDIRVAKPAPKTADPGLTATR